MNEPPLQPDAPRARGRELVLWSLLVLLVAGALLVLHAPNLQPSKLHLSGNFVDQAGYILTARTWLDTGKLESALLYPAYMDDPGWRLYMPGHYAALALSYALFGWGVWPSLLPSILGYLAAVLGVFLAGNALVGRTAGLIAAGLFATFSGVITYSFTAMAEMSFVGACAVALTGFALVPEQRRAYLTPLLLAVPFLFRETGALYVVPMAALLFYQKREGRFGRVALVLLASVALLSALNLWQLSTGKGSIPLSWVTDSTFNYGDAVPPAAPELSAAEWARRLFGNAARNGGEAWSYFVDARGMAAVSGFLILLGASLISLVGGLWLRGREPVVLAAGLLGLTACTIFFFLYDVAGEKGMRSMLFVAPWLALALGALLRPRRTTWTNRSRSLVGLLYGLAFLGIVFTNKELTRRAGFRMQRYDLAAGVSRQILESIGHDDDTLLVSHFNVSMEYAVAHYPVRLCFIPTNDESLRRVQERFGPIGTLIIPRDFLGKHLTPRGIQSIGLEGKRDIRFADRVMLVYQP